MGIMDKAKKFVEDNPDKVSKGIESVGDAFDKKTGGKHAKTVDKVQDAAQKRFGKAPQQ